MRPVRQSTLNSSSLLGEANLDTAESVSVSPSPQAPPIMMCTGPWVLPLRHWKMEPSEVDWKQDWKESQEGTPLMVCLP